MRRCFFFLLALLGLGVSARAEADSVSRAIEVTADQSLEWYQDQNLYVARGHAKAVRGDTTVTADLLTAHQREKTAATPKDKSGDIDRLTADGHVVIQKPNAVITGDHGAMDMDQHVAVVTGQTIRYESAQQIVTARDSLEYWDEKKLAVARGHAEAIKGDRHVSGDTLTAEFRDQPNGTSQLYKMAAIGHVTVVTQKDVTRGDKAIYDAARDIAIITGHVRITRADGTQLTGDVGESNFATNQSRLLTNGEGRVRALLPVKETPSKETQK